MRVVYVLVPGARSSSSMTKLQQSDQRLLLLKLWAVGSVRGFGPYKAQANIISLVQRLGSYLLDAGARCTLAGVALKRTRTAPSARRPRAQGYGSDT
jgi:hypothetical protein